MNSVKSLTMAAILSLCFFSSCRQKIDPGLLEHFDDSIFSSKETEKYVTAIGRKGVYVLAGKYVGSEPGVLLAFNGKRYFIISEFIAAYPNLASERVKAAAQRQQRWIEKVRFDGKHRLQPSSGYKDPEKPLHNAGNPD